jgi:hypothetical protein
MVPANNEAQRQGLQRGKRLDMRTGSILITIN